MTFSRQWATGISDNDPVTGAKLTQLDLNVSRALDAYAGGSGTPSSPIVLNGTGGGAGFAMKFEKQPGLTTQTIIRQQALTPMLGAAAGSSDLPTDWFFYSTALGWIQQTTGSVLYFPLANLIDLATLTKIRITLKGAAGAGGAYSGLPGGLPTLKVEYVDPGGVVQAPSPTVTDPAGSTGVFNVAHVIEVVLDTPLVIDQTVLPRQLYARLDGVGAGFEANKLGAIALECDFEVGRLTPGG